MGALWRMHLAQGRHDRSGRFSAGSAAARPRARIQSEDVARSSLDLTDFTHFLVKVGSRLFLLGLRWLVKAAPHRHSRKHVLFSLSVCPCGSWPSSRTPIASTAPPPGPTQPTPTQARTELPQRGRRAPRRACTVTTRPAPLWPTPRLRLPQAPTAMPTATPTSTCTRPAPRPLRRAGAQSCGSALPCNCTTTSGAAACSPRGAAPPAAASTTLR